MTGLFQRIAGALLSVLAAGPVAAEPTAHERLVTIGTDVATFLIFHPDDLAHRVPDPIAWYAYDFAYRRESAAGRLIGFATGADGGYVIRLTTGAASAREREHAGARWDYPLIVRHGRVYLDNADGLPGEEKMDDPSAFPERWFSLPNGAYRVTVQAVLRPARDSALPDYVVSFQLVEAIAGIAPSPNLPDLRQRPGWAPVPSPSQDLGYGLWRPLEQDVVRARLLDVPESSVLLPGEPFRLDLPEEAHDDYKDALSEYRVLRLGAAGPSVLARINGLSKWPGRGSRLSFSVLAPVSLDGPPGSEGEVSFRPLPKPSMTADAASVTAFKTLVSEAVGRLTDPPSTFERERFEALDEAETVTHWALSHLPLTASERLDWYGRDADARMRLMTEAMARGR